ncbi:MAG TPA: peptide deformylase, partial [Marmoricola sp.]|nr:peptide deformylase [Marmoricola sp.]
MSDLSTSAVAAWHEGLLGVEGRVLAVVAAPAEVLSHPGPKVDPASPEIVQLAADLVATMRVSPGCVGLAAPQVGISAQMFCV